MNAESMADWNNCALFPMHCSRDFDESAGVEFDADRLDSAKRMQMNVLLEGAFGFLANLMI